MLAKVACALKSVVATNALVSSRVRGGHAELLRLTASGCSVRVSFTPFFPSLPRSEQPFALKMSTRAASRARGKRALCVFMTWMLAAPLSVFAGDDADELIPPGLLPRLPEGLRTALRSVAQQAARAAAVSRLACVSTGVNALAAESSMAAHNRAASNAKLAATSPSSMSRGCRRSLCRGVRLARRCLAADQTAQQAGSSLRATSGGC